MEYDEVVNGGMKPLNWLSGDVKSPPFSDEARRETGVLLRQLQMGHTLGMPHSRPMPSIGPRCHEIRVKDSDVDWRLVYRIDPQVIPIAAVFAKKTAKTPPSIIAACRKRLANYDRAVLEAERSTKKRNEGQSGERG